MSPAEGSNFAGFTVIRLLGAGGMGEVYLVQHPRLPRYEALKVLRRDWSADADFRARFVREADVAASLSHPHIVAVHDRGEHDGQLWISMDYIDGTDLSALLTSHYPHGMPLPMVSAIVTAIASALDHAHHRGLLHRDVKPANILIGEPDAQGTPRILLTDFGIARATGDVSGLTATNMTLGTVAYSAPEQLLGEDLDGRADQYALAATAFHLLTGTKLFENSNPVAMISAHLHTAPPLPGQRRSDLAALDPVFATALAKDPQYRFHSASEFARHLSAVVHRPEPTLGAVPPPRMSAPLPYPPTQPPRPTPAAPASPAAARRRGGILAVAAIVAVIAAVVAGFLLFPSDTADTAAPVNPADQAAAVAAGQRYLEALAAGDAQAALDLAVAAPADARFLTDEVLGTQLSALPIRDILVTSAPPAAGDDPARVQNVVLAATFGDQRSEVELAVEKHGDRWLLPAVTADAYVATPGSPILNVATIAGVPMQGIPAATLFPGAVPVGSDSPAVDITAEATPMLLDRLLPPGRVTLTPTATLTLSGEVSVRSAVAVWMVNCYNNTRLLVGCPTTGRTADTTPEGIRPGTTTIGAFADVNAVKVQFDPDRLSATVLAADLPVTAEAQSSTGEPTTYTVPFTVDGTVDVSGSPPFTFTYTRPR